MATRRVFIVPLFVLSGAAALAGSTETPFALDPVEVSAEKRVELAFRTLQISLERGRSDRVEDADVVVCLKQMPVGSHVPVINCATNRFWIRIRAASLANGLAGYEGSRSGPGGSGMDSVGVPGGKGASKRADEKVVTLTLSDYNTLKKRYGELPEELRDLQ